MLCQMSCELPGLVSSGLVQRTTEKSNLAMGNYLLL